MSKTLTNLLADKFTKFNCFWRFELINYIGLVLVLLTSILYSFSEDMVLTASLLVLLFSISYLIQKELTHLNLKQELKFNHIQANIKNFWKACDETKLFIANTTNLTYYFLSIFIATLLRHIGFLK